MYQNVPDTPVFTRQPNLKKPLFYAKIKGNHRWLQKLFNKIETEKYKLLHHDNSLF